VVWVECYYVKKIAQRHGPHGNTETGAHQGNNHTHNENEEEFIVSWARELPTDQPLKIIVHLPDTQASRPEIPKNGNRFSKTITRNEKLRERDDDSTKKHLR